jgi:4-amino-4-deoxy-L-arabinose transferase-like glycosyltransferase
MTTITLPPPQLDPAAHAGSPARPAPPAQRHDPPWRLRRALRGRPGDPRWVRPSLLTLLGVTALLYLWDLGASGTANSFYAAAVQAGTKSWKAFFFGSFDSANAITVDKPPGSLWVMELSGRLFGFNSWSMLVPQALEGVASVGLLYAAVRRWSGPVAGLLAGAALAVTPAATLMFRFNNPDALLTLLLVAAAYCTVRAVEAARTTWLVLAGVAIGFGFLTKMGQALLIVPALGLVYLVAADTPLRRRVIQLLAAGVAMLASAGWWVAIVSVWPASDRPYIGGSTNNTVLNLVFGYNGLGRLFGGSGNGGGGGGTSTAGAGGMTSSGFGGSTGWTRLFRSEIAAEISWLLPAALLSLTIGLWLTRRAPRTDRTRAALLLWGGWLVVTGVVFSFMQGTFHPYYTVALAPAIAALVAITGRELWRRRAQFAARVSLAAVVAVTVVWAEVLLARTPSWLPGLRVLLAVTAVPVLGLLLLGGRPLRRSAAVVAAVAALSGLAGSSAYAVATASVPHTGSIPSVGPASSAGLLGGGRPSGGGSAPTGTAPSGGPGGFTPPTSTSSTSTTATASGSGGGGETANSALVTLLKATTTKWAAATIGSQTAAPLELSSGKAVMSIGGFNGGDASPTLAQFEAYVAQNQIRYFVASSGGGGAAGGGTGSQITAWVAAHFTSTTVGGTSVYDLNSAKTTG